MCTKNNLYFANLLSITVTQTTSISFANSATFFSSIISSIISSMTSDIISVQESSSTKSADTTVYQISINAKPFTTLERSQTSASTMNMTTSEKTEIVVTASQTAISSTTTATSNTTTITTIPTTSKTFSATSVPIYMASYSQAH
eukprot:NODE_30_length_32972_cov_0.541052.p17 type:complete len:145 gc:universal NODE_30_length_32972_cov_0.541052:29689-30123(+)